MPVKKKAVSAKAAGRSRSGAASFQKAAADPGAAEADRRLLARRQLSDRLPALSAGQSSTERPLSGRRPEADHCRPLGYLSGAELHLHPSGSGHQAG